jgi:hypothetical protein
MEGTNPISSFLAFFAPKDYIGF